MSTRKPLQRITGLMLVVLLLAGCGATPAKPTETSVPPASTPVPPTAPFTPAPPTATFTPMPPTATFTPVPPTATPTPSHPFFSAEAVLEIPSISATVGEGAVSFMEGEEPGTLRIEANGTVPAVDGEICLWCMETMQMAPNLNLPTEIFVEKSADELAGLVVRGNLRTYLQSETITLSDGTKVNVMKQPPVIDRVELSDAVLHVPFNTEASEFIASGPDGVTLRKEGKGFLLVEGQAYILQTTSP